MEHKVRIEYTDIVSAVKQFSVSELEALISSISIEIAEKKSGGVEDIKSILLSAPSWSETDYQNYKKARDYFNKSRLS